MLGAPVGRPQAAGEAVFYVFIVMPNGELDGYLIQDGKGILRSGVYGQFPDIAAETEKYLDALKKNPPKHQDDRGKGDLFWQSITGDWGVNQTPPGGNDLRRKRALRE